MRYFLLNVIYVWESKIRANEYLITTEKITYFNYNHMESYYRNRKHELGYRK